MSIGLWTLWLAAVMAAPSVLRLCPLHDLPPGAAAVAAAPTATHVGHAHHPSCHGDAAGPRHDHGPGHDGRPCHCLGDCCAGAVAALPTADIRLALGERAAAREAVSWASRVAPTAPDHLLPFANGPPAAAA